MFDSAQQETLARGAKTWGLSLSGEALGRFARYAEMLEEANRQFNLTRIPPEEAGTRHFLDSLALAAAFAPPPGQHLIDVGTGAGFPGLPLAIAYPRFAVTLLDGTLKRLRFLDAVIADLGLTNVRTVHGRAEEIARLPDYRERFDLVTTRAVAKLTEIAAWTLPLARPGGLSIAYKGREIAEELRAAETPIAAQGGKVERTVEVLLPETDIVRSLVLIRKVRSAPLPASASARRRAP